MFAPPASRNSERVAIAVQPGETVVVSVADAISVTERLRPAVTVLDVDLPVPSGFYVTHELLNRKLTRAVVIHTTFADDGTALAALVAGASAVVVKSGLGDELTDAVRAAARGGGVRPRVTIDGLVEAAWGDATNRVLGMLVHGTSPAEIGETLGVHERELAGRRKRMLRALLGD